MMRICVSYGSRMEEMLAERWPQTQGQQNIDQASSSSPTGKYSHSHKKKSNNFGHVKITKMLAPIKQTDVSLL